MSDIIIHMDDFRECCICLESDRTHMVQMTCCKNEIHQHCLFRFFITKVTVTNGYVPCPLCRNKTIVSDVYTLDVAKTLFSEQDKDVRATYLRKMKGLLVTHYSTNTFFYSVDADVDTANIVIVPFYKKYRRSILYIILFCIFVLGLVLGSL